MLTLCDRTVRSRCPHLRNRQLACCHKSTHNQLRQSFGSRTSWDVNMIEIVHCTETNSTIFQPSTRALLRFRRIHRLSPRQLRKSLNMIAQFPGQLSAAWTIPAYSTSTRHQAWSPHGTLSTRQRWRSWTRLVIASIASGEAPTRIRSKADYKYKLGS